MKNNKSLYIKILAAIFFVGMVVVNALANILPINGINTGAVSNLYPNLFAPAGMTFSIWGVIYLLLLIYTIYQFTSPKDQEDKEKKEKLFNKVGVYFIISSIANILWIFSWHHLLIPLTVLLIIIILVCLLKIAKYLDKQELSNKEKLCIKLPFSIYFGWITVATIANITVFLVSVGFSGWGIAPSVWTMIVLFVGALIGIIRLIKDRDIAYGLVFIWAYFGIYLKHMTTFGGEYKMVIISLISFIALFILAEGYILYKQRVK